MPFVKVVYHGVVMLEGLEYGPEDEPFEVSADEYDRLSKKGIVELADGEDEEDVMSQVSVPVEVSTTDLDLEENVLDKLIDAGFETDVQIRAASDESLLAINGVGKGTLAKIRKAVKE